MDRKTDSSSEAKGFYSAVFPAELEAIKARRTARGYDAHELAPLNQPIDGKLLPRSERGLTGLALSGGGIRSATFNLGLLQGMAQIRNGPATRQALLPLFDYLSTVSGGGYIGSWLAGWIRNDRADSVEEELRGKPRKLICETNESPEPPQIQHLRSYSNYLTPELGFFSADTWTLIATYLRNTFVNQLVFIPLLAAVLLLPRWTAAAVDASSAAIAIPVFGLAAAAMGRASYAAARQEKAFGRGMLLLLVCLPLVLAAFLLLWLPLTILPAASPGDAAAWVRRLFVGGGWAAAFIALNLLGWVLSRRLGDSDGARLHPWRAGTTWGMSAVLAGVVGGWFFSDIFLGFADRYWSDPPGHLVVWGPPVALLLFVMALNIQLGLRGKYERDMSREWWGSMTGWVLIFGSGWLVLAVIAIYGPLLFELLHEWVMTRYALIGSWLLATLGTILAGRSPKSGEFQSASWLDSVAKTLAPIAALGLLLAIAIGLNALLLYIACDEQATLHAGDAGALLSMETEAEADEGAPQIPYATIIAEYWDAFRLPQWSHIVLLLVGCLVVAGTMGYTLDINQFSMHAVYRNRLVRCYLRAIRKPGASRPNPVTEFDLCDDFPLSKLIPKKNGYDGPYLLMNAALNLTSPPLPTHRGTDVQAPQRLRWQERKAAAFIFSPRYCGSNLTNYRETENYAGKDGIKLGTALAISGAAFTSNMGYHTNRALAFFLSLFNVRLGWWLGNPRHDKYGEEGPRWGLYYLMAELFGMANEERDYVYLSDGGHFDNLGLYELVRRRCRYIVCADAGEDGGYTFDDLGMAIRKIRADFGVEVEINLDMLKPQAGQRYSRWHHAIGTIRYDKVDEGSPVGMLVYVKASLVGDEPADVLEYKANHPDFPHETTLDQLFSESQFEAYRSLGEHIGREIFRHAQHKLG